MAYQRSTKVTKNLKSEPIGRQPVYHGLYVGVVKEVLDSSGSGRLKVWIAEMGTSEDDASSWITVNYCSPFFGSTPVSKNEEKETFEATQTSYGMWFVPPDPGNRVLVGFINGSKSTGVWLGVMPDLYANRMVPAVAAGKAHTNAGKNDVIQTDVPQAEYNKTLSNPRQQAVEAKDDKTYLRPYAKYHAEGLTKQGLIQDTIRGIDYASARRDAQSEVYGINTPGPKIDEKSTRRKGGSSFIMDDKEGHEKVRIRTRSGAQMLLDETNGIVYFINRDGTAWIEMDAEGNVDVFSAKNVTLRAEEDFNIRADRDINFEAGRNVHIKAAKNYQATGEHPTDEDAGAGGDIYIEARNDAKLLVKNNALLTVNDGNLDINIKTGNTTINTKQSTSVKSEGAITLESLSTFDIKSSSTYKLDASEVGIKSGNINLDTSGNTKVTGTIASDGEMFAPDFKAPSIGLVGHKHKYNPGPNPLTDTATPNSAGGSAPAVTGPAASAANTAQEVPKKETITKTNIKNEDLGLPDIKSAIQKLIDNVRNKDIKTLIPRWLTREPCPEKKKD